MTPLTVVAKRRDRHLGPAQTRTLVCRLESESLAYLLAAAPTSTTRAWQPSRTKGSSPPRSGTRP